MQLATSPPRPARRQRARGAARLAWAALCCLPAFAQADRPVSPLELTRRINPEPACTRRRIQGLCWCGATPCGYQVQMYVPVAFVETVRAPGDSLLGLPLPLPGGAPADGTASSSHSALDHTAEAHAWLLGDTTWLLSGQPPCLQCRPSDARARAPAPSPAADSLCDPVSTVAAGLAGAASSALAQALPVLAYASELDPINWRTGCRDLLAIDSWITPGGSRPELGRWGPLHPRQMRDLGTSPVVYSAKTSYRALSIARDQLATFPFPVDPAARMQQAYPAVSTCFAIGEQPLPEASSSERPVQTSPDGRYGWLYWRPVSCCVGFQSLAQCAVAQP